jgi:PhnB protein
MTLNPIEIIMEEKGSPVLLSALARAKQKVLEENRDIPRRGTFMPNPVKPIPDGYHTVTPYMVVSDASRQIDFVKRAFDAKELHRSLGPDGKVAHAEVSVGDSRIMIGGARPGQPPIPCMLYLYVADTDAAYQRTIEAGATSVMAPANQFYGDRNGGVKDADGNQWWIATHVEDVSPEEIQKRMQALYGPKK